MWVQSRTLTTTSPAQMRVVAAASSRRSAQSRPRSPVLNPEVGELCVMGRHDLHPIVQRERTLGRLMSADRRLRRRPR